MKVEHLEAIWLNDPKVASEVEWRERLLADVMSPVDHHVCPVGEHPDSGCRLPTAHQVSGAGLSINQVLKLGEVYVTARLWAEWRKGQCDYPEGINPEEQALIDALE